MHFCVRENRILDILGARIDVCLKMRIDPLAEKRKVHSLLRRWNHEGRFNIGNGEKILKRLLSMAHRLDIDVEDSLLRENLYERPGVRDVSLRIISRRSIDAGRQAMIIEFLNSGMVCDNITLLNVAYCVVEAPALNIGSGKRFARKVSRAMKHRTFFPMYSKLWLATRFGGPSVMLEYVRRNYEIWRADPWLGRLVGGLFPIFAGTRYYGEYSEIIASANNYAVLEVFYFHRDLQLNGANFAAIRGIVAAANPSRAFGISHQKMLVLLSIRASAGVSDIQKERLIKGHSMAWKDAIYKSRARAAIKPTRQRVLIV